MAKVALLIGVSEYGEGLSKLPGTQTDIQTLHPVLQNPQIGGFDSVQLLPNPDRAQMEYEIEKLFSDDRSRDDLILLYFSGHGVRDDDGTLYFATCNTEKSPQGQIRTSTAVSATELQRYMGKSRSKRQVLILDCCFSGAFANDMKAKADEAIDVKAQLGSEGCVVLTSSSATQHSFEKEGASIYTRYLVQGLETGDADRNKDGYITVDELHEYAREKVQEVVPTMRPEIYVVQEGYKIRIARVPHGDLQLGLREEVDTCAKPWSRRKLLWAVGLGGMGFTTSLVINTLGFLQSPASKPTQSPASKPTQSPASEPTQSPASEPTQSPASKPTQSPASEPTQSPASEPTQSPASEPTQSPASEPTQSPASEPTQSPASEPTQSLTTTLDYTNLESFLQEQRWKDADQETVNIMLKVTGRESAGWLARASIQHFPCHILAAIDQLWVQYSNSKFGFSVQKRIWEEVGSPTEYNTQWESFADRVGWRKEGRWVFDDELIFNLSDSSVGELPFWGLIVGRGRWDGFFDLFSRTETCEL